MSSSATDVELGRQDMNVVVSVLFEVVLKIGKQLNASARLELR